ncbi:MAG: hypothetical protein QXF01_00075 [Candidatus Micrarchaeaceae archaeon]
MKMQSALEFLSTYSYVFIVIGIALVSVLLLENSAQASLVSQCYEFGGFECNYVYYYSNISGYYSVASFSLSNSQSVPLNVTNFSVVIGNTKSSGLCTPTFVYPGQTSVCEAVFNIVRSPAAIVQGTYSIGAKYCNGGISAIPQGICTQPTTYAGSFLAYSSQLYSQPLGISVAEAPAGLGAPSYSSIQPMHLPANFILVQNGGQNVGGISGSLVYSFGTSDYVGTVALGNMTSQFPQSASMLNSASSCNASQPQLLSMFYTTIYIRGSDNAESIETTNAMAVYYRPANILAPWNSIFGSSAWKGGLSTYSSNTVIGSGLYSIEAVWYAPPCSQALQTLNIS